MSIIQKRAEAQSMFHAYLASIYPDSVALYEHTEFLSGNRHRTSVFIGVYRDRGEAYQKQGFFYVANFCNIVTL